MLLTRISYKFLIIALFAPTLAITLRSSDIPEDARLNFTELAFKYGRVCEEHLITTPDGYVLTVFRLRGNETRPALLMHGIFGTADDFIIRGNTSLAVTLAAAGYDVWLGNYRGNRYSRRHIRLIPDDDTAFWDFGPYEHACYDLATTLDFVLDKTGQKTLILIGFSQGTTISYILLSVKPKYNERVKVFIALAPIVYLSHLSSPLSKLVPFADLISTQLQLFNQHEIFSFYSLSKAVLEQLCSQKPIGYILCLNNILFPVVGFNPSEYEAEFISVLFGHFPAASSRQNLMELAYIAKSRVFGRIDYGTARNLIAYRSPIAPRYDLAKISVETHMFTARNDRMSRLKDVAYLKKKLPNAVHDHLMESPNFCHIDYIWGKEGHKIVAKSILHILKNYV